MNVVRYLASYLVKRQRQARRRQAVTPLFRADAALLAAAVRDWRKVARLVSEVWQRLPSRWQTEASVRFLTCHVARLEVLGQFEAQGDIRRIRFSEVRLARRRGDARSKPAQRGNGAKVTAAGQGGVPAAAE